MNKNFDCFIAHVRIGIFRYNIKEIYPIRISIIYSVVVMEDSFGKCFVL